MTAVGERGGSRRGARMAPLFLAGFTTAFGAHGVAAALGTATNVESGGALVGLAAALAVYDLAEIVLKPVFGVVADRVGAKPVVVAGLVAFAAVSLAGVFAGAAVVVLVRFGQGAAAAAFSPAASTAVARLAGQRAGGAFGRYGAWKSLGYALGPFIGAALISVGGVRLLDGILALLALGAAAWAAVVVPRVEPVPRQRATLLSLARETASRSFLLPTLVLAASMAAFTAAIGFLPALGTHFGLAPIAASATAVVLALLSSGVQPVAGRALDARRLPERAGLTGGLLLCVAGLGLLAAFPSIATMFVAAIGIGVGVGLATPIAFASLAATTPTDRLGRVMGSAEVGRELGDIGGPLLVGVVAAAAGLTVGLAALGAGLALVSVVTTLSGRGRAVRATPPHEPAPTDA